MRLQEKPGWCSVACVQNALRCLGIKKPQRAIKALMDLTDETYEEEIVRALLANGVSADSHIALDANVAREWLDWHVGNHGPAIVLVDDSEHFVTVIGICGDSYIVFDPSNVAQAETENGVRVYSWRSLKARWQAFDEAGQRFWFAVGVSK